MTEFLTTLFLYTVYINIYVYAKIHLEPMGSTTCHTDLCTLEVQGICTMLYMYYCIARLYEKLALISSSPDKITGSPV